MRDPHVVALHYRVVTPSGFFAFKDPPPLEAERGTFRFQLKDGALRVEMKDHHATEASARSLVQPFLAAWEVDFALQEQRREMRFEFARAEVVDRHPDDVRRVVATGEVSFFATTTVKKLACEYPPPPAAFAASEDVETLMLHFEAFASGKERLVDAAYFCLTLLERRAGGRPEAASEFTIDFEVLRKIGFLTSDQVGDERTARKLSHRSSLRPHTREELAWLQAALRALIRRVGEYDFNPAGALVPITLADLPALPS